jgi:uncharacterized phage protein gp47/JayE
MFENKSVSEIYNIIITGLQNELNTNLKQLQKSFANILAKVFASVYITLYKLQAWTFLQLFVDTASFDEVEILGRRLRPLVMWGELVGIGDPKPASIWQGKAKVTVTQLNTYLPAATQFKSNVTGKVYYTLTAVLLDDEEKEVPVRCAEAGTSGNLDTDDEIQLANSLAMIENKAYITETDIEAKDAESESAYRQRVKERWRIQPQGGALADYRKWAQDVEGVYNTYVYKDEETQTGVLLYVCADPSYIPDRIPTQDMLIAVGDACTWDPVTGVARKPIGAVIDPDYNRTYANIFAVEPQTFDVYINGYDLTNLESFRDLAKDSLKMYFEAKEPYIRGLSIDYDKNDFINAYDCVATLSDIANSVGGFFTGVKVHKDGAEITTYTLGRGEIASFGKLFVNGVEM